MTSLNKGYHDLITLWAAEIGYLHEGEQLFFTKKQLFFLPKANAFGKAVHCCPHNFFLWRLRKHRQANGHHALTPLTCCAAESCRKVAKEAPSAAQALCACS